MLIRTQREEVIQQRTAIRAFGVTTPTLDYDVRLTPSCFRNNA